MAHMNTGLVLLKRPFLGASYWFCLSSEVHLRIRGFYMTPGNHVG